MSAACINGRLPITTILEIAGDYAIGLGGAASFVRSRPVFPFMSVFLRALIVFAPIEFTQPRLGWVHYRRCRTEWWMPQQTTWILHSLWDAMIVVALVHIAVLVVGRRALRRYDARVTVIVGIAGMLQEIALEARQTLWVYVPTLLNPQWATVNGRAMTLQQWHWAFIPGLVYKWALQGPPRSYVWNMYRCAKKERAVECAEE